jgi:carboxymethylenebutenolidase
MDPNVVYLAEEVAENHADGALTRREAMRRLTYLGFGAVSASALLAACSKDHAAGPVAPATSAPAPVAGGAQATGPTTPPVATQSITFPGDGFTLQAVFAPAASAKGAVLVMHENRGITDFIISMTGRLAGSGYTALAVDLLSKQGGTAAHPDPAELQSVLGDNASTGQAVKDMKAALVELGRRAPGHKLGVTGFCFGGNMAWDLLAAGDPPPLAAGVPFYGQAANPDFSKTKAAVLAIYAGLDTRVNANQSAAKMGLDAARLTSQMRTFPGVNHAFMNNTGTSYDPTQAAAAYQAMIDWFAKYLS